MPASASALCVPPVERSSTPAATSRFAKGTRPVLSETERSARRTMWGTLRREGVLLDPPGRGFKVAGGRAIPAAMVPNWSNPWRWLPRARWGVQLAYVAFLVFVALRFASFVDQAVGDGAISVARPPAVEAFLPIAALMAAKRFFLTGFWDGIHPAGLTILLAALATAFLARKAFCSWVCPVGTLSRGLEWLGGKTLWRRGFLVVPRWLDYALTAL